MLGAIPTAGRDNGRVIASRGRLEKQIPTTNPSQQPDFQCASLWPIAPGDGVPAGMADGWGKISWPFAR